MAKNGQRFAVSSEGENFGLGGGASREVNSGGNEPTIIGATARATSKQTLRNVDVLPSSQHG